MQHLSAADLSPLLDHADLVDALALAFAAPVTVPVRHHHTIEQPGGQDATLLLMPAWRQGGAVGIKVATVFPDNGAKGLETVQANYLLLDGQTGVPLALLDGPELTARRTACASALAARYLARQDARHLTMVGTGKLVPHLIRAHASQRPISTVTIWGRDLDKATALAAELDGRDGLSVVPSPDLKAAVAAADIVSCATLSKSPLVLGDWLPPGCHLDLVGAFRPDMRECDSDAVARAQVFVDTRAGALKEAGDLATPIAEGRFSAADVAAELAELCRGQHPGRRDAAAITLFKSVGTALEDLAAAELAWKRATKA